MFSVPTTSPATVGGRAVSPLPAKVRIAAIGGGTGLPNVLRGLCSLLYAGSTRQQPGDAGADQLVAVVTTTDDGGSSGRLRRDFGVIPPGDIRNCLAALAEDQSLLTALFQYRFEGSDGLNGHALGNLMLTALTEVTGDFVKAVEIAARVLVLNLMTEPGETADFDAARHLEVVEEHLGFQPFDHVIFNTAPIPAHLSSWYAERGAAPIVVSNADIARFRGLGVQPLGAPLASEGPSGRVRHHPGRLAATVLAAARLAPRQPLPFREGSH